MLEQEINLLKSELDGIKLDQSKLLDASRTVFKVRHALYALEQALEEAYRGDKVFAAIRYKEFKEDMQEAE